MSVTLRTAGMNITQPDGSSKQFDIVDFETTAQALARIEAKKNEALEQIPDDYTELSGDVSQLSYLMTKTKEDVDNLTLYAKGELVTTLTGTAQTNDRGYIMKTVKIITYDFNAEKDVFVTVAFSPESEAKVTAYIVDDSGLEVARASNVYAGDRVRLTPTAPGTYVALYGNVGVGVSIHVTVDIPTTAEGSLNERVEENANEVALIHTELEGIHEIVDTLDEGIESTEFSVSATVDSKGYIQPSRTLWTGEITQNSYITASLLYNNDFDGKTILYAEDAEGTLMYKEDIYPRGSISIYTEVPLTKMSVYLAGAPLNTEMVLDFKVEKKDENTYNNRVPRIIRIYNSDTAYEVVSKMVQAFQYGNVDVIFQNGIYDLSSELLHIREHFGLSFEEIPIGHSCRYFFNASTLIGRLNISEDAEDKKPYANLLGSQRSASDYELHDGRLIGVDIRYCVHDECQAWPNTYRHVYDNMRMDYTRINRDENIPKCIGGGTGGYGTVIINGCVFNCNTTGVGANSRAVTYHGNGNTRNPKDSIFRISVTNSYFSDGFSVFDLSVAGETPQKAEILFSGNSYALLSTPADNCELYAWGNTLRSLD